MKENQSTQETMPPPQSCGLEVLKLCNLENKKFEKFWNQITETENPLPNVEKNEFHFPTELAGKIDHEKQGPDFAKGKNSSTSSVR